jgi:hypothetical protein
MKGEDRMSTLVNCAARPSRMQKTARADTQGMAANFRASCRGYTESYSKKFCTHKCRDDKRRGLFCVRDRRIEKHAPMRENWCTQ